MDGEGKARGGADVEESFCGGGVVMCVWRSKSRVKRGGKRFNHVEVRFK